VLRETTSRGVCGLVCPSRTSECLRGFSRGTSAADLHFCSWKSDLHPDTLLVVIIYSLDAEYFVMAGF